MICPAGQVKVVVCGVVVVAGTEQVGAQVKLGLHGVVVAGGVAYAPVGAGQV